MITINNLMGVSENDMTKKKKHWWWEDFGQTAPSSDKPILGIRGIKPPKCWDI